MGLAARVCLQSGILAIAWAAAAPLAYQLRGIQGLAAAGVAAGICWLGAVGAAPIAALFHGPSAVMVGIGLSMLARTVLPLIVGVTLHAMVPALAEGGMIYYLLAFYLLTLATETVVSVAQIPRSPKLQKAI